MQKRGRRPPSSFHTFCRSPLSRTPRPAAGVPRCRTPAGRTPQTGRRLHAGLGHHGFHDVPALLRLHQDEHQLPLLRDGNAEELLGRLHACALGMDIGAAGGTGAAGSVHHLVGVALVRNNNQQFMCNLGLHTRLPFLPQQIFFCRAAADAGQRHRHQNAPAGHVQPQVLLRLAHQPGVPGRNAHQHGLFRGLQPQIVQHLCCGRAMAQRRQYQRNPLGLIPGRKLPALVPVRDRDDQHSLTHGGSSPFLRHPYKSIISSSSMTAGCTSSATAARLSFHL